MAYTRPVIADFKAQFARDFPYAVPLAGGGDATDSSKVMDTDITSALALANMNINDGLFALQSDFTTAYNYLAAHYLCANLQASGAGLGGQFTWLTAAKNVGSISESVAIPERMMKSPYLSMISKTTYGAIYLSIIAPLLVGNVSAVVGNTKP